MESNPAPVPPANAPSEAENSAAKFFERMIEKQAELSAELRLELAARSAEDSARVALLDADFFAFDGIDADDAQRMGFVLGEIAPPVGASDGELTPRMMQTLRTER